ncbi:NAD-dependent epimerase/dehydratase family protein [Chondromyces apiculatus]|uniref:Ribosome-associated endonuclease n=1 Tax=Chondromyces apiculatus DSM 436 TaxID=1192034 RepID=A0A017TGL3_9BACT|nr:NAD-dependent epimerase/dehydratase family protein [Chondromyces apiculatus]EYF08433.1 Ribosome-associated endonuclease [Chondromyces apiculatus DSM 436]
MRVLVLGGTHFIGFFIVQRLLAAGHDVTLFNRGISPDPFGPRVHRLHGDRHGDGLAHRLGGREFDAAVDLLAYTESDARGAIQALRNRVGHYVMISTGQVYLVRQDCPVPATEADYDGPLLPDPAEHTTAPAAADALPAPSAGPASSASSGAPSGASAEALVHKASYDYGVHKRACEDTLAAAWEAERFPVTRLRIPMVEGPRDPQRRVEAYLARILDGGPLLLPTFEGASPHVRHVYVVDIADTVLTVLRSPGITTGQVYNLCQQEMPTLPEYLTLLAASIGAPPPPLVPVPASALTAAGLDPRLVSPFSSRWMSCIDPDRAVSALGFKHRPLAHTLDILTTNLLAHPPSDPVPGRERRADEIALATRHAGATS